MFSITLDPQVGFEYFWYCFIMFLTVVNLNCELSTSPEASYVVIFKMAAISDTQKIYMYMYEPCFNLNELCVNLFIVMPGLVVLF